MAVLMSPQTYRQALETLEAQGMLRGLQPIGGPQDRVIVHQGREYLNFSSNNYLGLANHPELIEATIAAVRQYGVGAGASRLVNGSTEIFHQLERDLAEFKGTEAALVFNSGYHANLGALTCLAGEGDVLFSDALNHASMIDGIRLSKARCVIYRHGDLDDLRSKLQEEKKRRSSSANFFIATETVFSMDGDVVSLEELAGLAQEFDAWLYLDEAHATGVFGARGAGLAEGLRFRKEFWPRVIQMGTLGKALGCFGAYVAAGNEVIEFLINRSRPFIYTTALPPAVAAAARKALEIVRSDSSRRDALWERVRQLGAALKINTFSPIVPIVLGDPNRAVSASRCLRETGFWINAIRPPTVPAGTSRLRVTLMATHTEDDVRNLVRVLREIA